MHITDTLETLFDVIGREHLKTVLIEPLDAKEFDWHLARLSQLVAPAYLPFASDDSGTYAFHLWPDRDLYASPIVYIGDEQTAVHFICDSLATFPIGIWLWVGRYFKTEPNTLRTALETLVENIPHAVPVPEDLWEILRTAPEYEPTRWTAGSTVFTQNAWSKAQVGHPFVGLPDPGFDATPEAALKLIQPWVEKNPQPEVLSLLVATQVELGTEPEQNDVLSVVQAEAWRQTNCLLKGLWWIDGEGICAWDAVAQHLPTLRNLVRDTPFEVLAEHPRTYSGQDPRGAATLLEIGTSYRDVKHYSTALRQYRNAALVAILSVGSYSRELAESSAEICDLIHPGSLAAAVARRSASLTIDY